MKNILGAYWSSLGLKQFRCAETEKYAHVTFFFNDYTEKPFAGEDRQIVPSPRVRTYDLKPEMSAYEVCEVVLERLDSNKYDVIVINFANPDMAHKKDVDDYLNIQGRFEALTPQERKRFQDELDRDWQNLLYKCGYSEGHN